MASSFMSEDLETRTGEGEARTTPEGHVHITPTWVPEGHDLKTLTESYLAKAASYFSGLPVTDVKVNQSVSGNTILGVVQGGLIERADYAGKPGESRFVPGNPLEVSAALVPRRLDDVRNLPSDITFEVPLAGQYGLRGVPDAVAPGGRRFEVYLVNEKRPLGTVVSFFERPAGPYKL